MNPGFDYIGISTAFICHDVNGNVLLSKRSQNCRDEQGTWEFGGGKLEFGSTLEENLLREIKEEYGCEGKIEEKLPPITLLRNNRDGKTHWLAVPYIVRVNSSEAKLNEPESQDEIGWFRLDELPHPFHTGAMSILEAYQDRFKKYIA